MLSQIGFANRIPLVLATLPLALAYAVMGAEFDSEELDDQTFDWKDIRQARSPRILDVLFIDMFEIIDVFRATPLNYR